MEEKKNKKPKEEEKKETSKDSPGIAKIETPALSETGQDIPEEKEKEKPIRPKKKIETRGRKKGSKNKKPKTKKTQEEPPFDMPDIKIPLANFIMNLTHRIGGKWKADIEEAKFFEDSFDWWCTVRANWLKRWAPEIYLAIAAGNYFVPRLFPDRSEQKEEPQT